MDSLTIGRVAKQAGVNIETVRYYERRGLIAQPPTPSSGFRHYPYETIARIKFVKRSQELGFTLKEVGLLLSLRVDASTQCDEVKKYAQAKIIDINKKIESLQRIQHSLEDLVSACESQSPTSECPVLERLDSDPQM